jgi:hypothetical protein
MQATYCCTTTHAEYSNLKGGADGKKESPVDYGAFIG